MGKMDAVMHFFGGAAVAANFGETVSDITSHYVEVLNLIKYGVKTITGGDRGSGYDPIDFTWGAIGSELQNVFDVNECDSRALARKFRDGKFKIGDPKLWYGKSDKILYGE